jgi:hypothetical protein
VTIVVWVPLIQVDVKTGLLRTTETAPNHAKVVNAATTCNTRWEELLGNIVPPVLNAASRSGWSECISRELITQDLCSRSLKAGTAAFTTSAFASRSRVT